MQMSKSTMGSVVWRAGMASSMSVSLTRDTPAMHFVSLLQLGIPHSFAFVAYTHKLKDGKVRLGIRGGTFGMQVEYGAEKKVSQYSTVSATMTVGIPMGVSLKMRYLGMIGLVTLLNKYIISGLFERATLFLFRFT
jgi:DnaJ homolog subfamily C member 11